MNRILMILIILLLVSCADNNDNFLLDEILVGKDDPNAPILNLDNEIITANPSEKTELNAPITDFAENVAQHDIAPNNVLAPNNDVAANNAVKHATVTNKAIKKKATTTPLISTKKLDIIKSEKSVNKGKVEELLDIEHSQKTVDRNKAQALINTVRQNNLKARNKNNVQTVSDKNRTSIINRLDKKNEIKTANKPEITDTTEIFKPKEPIDPEKERNSLLKKARAGMVEVNDKNLEAFCRMSSQLVFYVTNNLIMELNSDYPRSIASTLPKVGIINTKNSFAYKTLKITESRLAVIKEKLKTTLPFNVAPYDDMAENYQSSYYANCLKVPNQYIFNYNRIFNTNSEPQWSSFLRRD